MKKLLFLVGIMLVVAISCKKSDDAPVFKQEQLNGTWENIEKDDDGCLNQLVIAANSMAENTICTGSSVSVPYQTYSFDGKVIKVQLLGLDAIYTINELTSTKLVMTLTVLGMDSKAEYKKIK